MPDETPLHELPVPQDPLPRESVTLKEKGVDANDETVSPAEETFATPTKRLPLTDTERDQLVQRLETVLTEIAKQRQDRGWDANWDLWEDAYFGVLADRPIPGQANVHVPLTQEVVDTIDAAVEQVLFSDRTWLGLQPREQGDIAAVKRQEQFLDYALKVPMRAKERLEPVRFEAAVLGTGVVYLPWLRETDRIRDEEVYDGAAPEDVQRFLQRYPAAQDDAPEIVRKLKKGERVTLTVEYTEALHDAPDPQPIPLRDWLVRDTAEYDRLHREPFVGHRFDVRWDDVVRLEEEGYYDAGVGARLKFSYDPSTKEYADNPTFAEDTFEITTGTLRWRKPGETRERRYLVDYHAKSRTMLRILAFPYWHNRVNYIPFYYQRSRRYIYGIALTQKIEHPQAELNAIHSLILDASAYSALPMFKARKGTEGIFNPSRDGLHMGKTWYFDNPTSDVEAFTIPASSVLGVLVGMESVAARHGELTSGAVQNLSGLESARDPQAPATKTIAQTTQAMMRVNRYITTFASSLVELGFQTVELYYQFAPRGLVFRVIGNDGAAAFPQITRQDLRLRADLYPHANFGALAQDKERAETIEFGKLALEFPEIKESPLKRMHVLEMMLDAGGPLWRTKKHALLPTAKQLALFERQDMKQTEALEQQLAQAGPPPPPRLTPGGPDGTLRPPA